MAEPKDLPDEVKTFIVTQLACWATPSEVAKAVKEDFKVEITRQSIEAYDPTKVAGKALSKRWRLVFEETRKQYLADTADIGIAQPTFRLRALERMFFKAAEMGNLGKQAELLKQAAEETGGKFVNSRIAKGDQADLLKELHNRVSGTAFRPSEKPKDKK